jgi:G3E family GTPase
MVDYRYRDDVPTVPKYDIVVQCKSDLMATTQVDRPEFHCETRNPRAKIIQIASTEEI